MDHKCNNQQFYKYDIETSKMIEFPCQNTWDGDKWNKDVDTEYTRNEKCSKCGGTDISGEQFNKI